MAFRIAQDYEYQGGDYWKWSVWIEASDEELAQIESVEYTLHPTFPDPVRVVEDRSSKFRLETAGWGVFRLYALVRLEGGSEAQLEHDLVLRKDRPEPEPPEPGVAAEPARSAPQETPPQADAFFEGPMFGAIAFAGALDAAADVGGINRWGRVGGASGGALVAAMLAVGYEPHEIRRVLQEVDFRRLVNWGVGGRFLRSSLRLFFGRGLARSDRLGALIDEILTAKVGHSPTFADVRDPESPAEVGGAGSRLRLLATDVTGVRLMIMPDNLADYDDGDGGPLNPEEFPLAEAVRISMSTAIFFEPTCLNRNGRPHYIVEGGVLSPFPVWLFDRPEPTRPTWGFLVGGIDETEVYRPISKTVRDLPAAGRDADGRREDTRPREDGALGRRAHDRDLDDQGRRAIRVDQGAGSRVVRARPCRGRRVLRRPEGVPQLLRHRLRSGRRSVVARELPLLTRSS